MPKSTTRIGRQAETAVADHLESVGHKILDKNWRTRLCEIDLVSQKDKVIYFVEVKYRASTSQGEGTEYITAKKLKQMTFAAENWVSQHDWDGDYRLLAASVTDATIELIEL